MHVNDYLTYIQNAEDRPFLRTPLLDVNMRLFKCNAEYRSLVRVCCDYLRRVALSDLDGYSRAFGMSGANLAIPFNIIGVVHNRGSESVTCPPTCHILINPEILEYSGPLVYTTSNCGSIRLPNSIKVLRYERVRVRYCNEAGDCLVQTFNRAQGAFTIQHEVDHNKGVLITDYGRIIPDASRTKV